MIRGLVIVILFIKAVYSRPGYRVLTLILVKIILHNAYIVSNDNNDDYIVSNGNNDYFENVDNNAFVDNAFFIIIMLQFALLAIKLNLL